MSPNFNGNLSFNEEMERMDWARLRQRIEHCDSSHVEQALSREHPTPEDFAALFSKAAVPYLESLAQRAAAITERRFGKVIQLYTPIYLSNECVNKCSYCGFSHELDIPRVTLTPAQLLDEAAILHNEGFRHLLVVSGEDRRQVNIPYLLEIIRGLHQRFDSIALEIQPLPTEEYRQLVEAGVDGLTIYQETYEPQCYAKHHLAGPKRNYKKRIDSIAEGGMAGMRSLGIGVLLGLYDWRSEMVALALHGRYLTKRFWESRIAVSFPRIRPVTGGFQAEHPVSDVDLVQMLCAMRLILPDAELVLSTRESARLRDRLLGLGVTRMSAGSRTQPGGYAHPEQHDGEQFSIEDDRTPEEVARMIAERGYEPVWKDFDRQFISTSGGKH
jgi:2-iminoacetate synthase